MSDTDISRREVLARVGTGVGALTIGAGNVAARGNGRYNVGTSTPAAAAAARRAADRVDRVLGWDGGKKTVTGRFPAEALKGLRNRPDVRYVEADGQMEAISIDSSDPEVPWGVDRVDAEKAHANGETGGGADIAIVDTGLDDDHPDLAANVGVGTAYTTCSGSNCNYAWSDDNDHGTHCGGIADAVNDDSGVVGVSTEATLHAVKVLDANGSGTYSNVASGIQYVADRGWDVASMSLGGGKSYAVEDAVEYAASKGVLLVAAAGNDGPCSNCVSYPAAEPEVIGVSATDRDDSLASFSSTGSAVELAAPGARVYSTVVDGYATYSGTSMACPHVAGAGGQLMANGLTAAEARDKLASTAEDVGLAASEQGNGLLDVPAALDGSGGGTTDAAPSVSWVAPSDGATVSGSVAVQVDASDAEDADDSLTVEWQVDGGTWHTASYDAGTGYYEGSWDSTGVSDGDHALDARATDSASNTSSAGVTVTVSNGGSTGNTAPAVDDVSLTDRGNPAWTRYDVSWTVSDADGDLASVTSELLDSSGKAVDSASSNVGGTSASGTHDVRTKRGASAVRVTVTDSAGDSASTTRSL